VSQNISKKYASQMTPQIAVRIPVDLKEWLRQEAQRNQSSQNSELVRALRERKDRLDGRRGPDAA